MEKDCSQLGSPDDTSLREYVVIVESHDQLDSLYEDLETEGGSDTIPERACECSRRKPLFRSTRYKLTYEEARKILDDERVIAVELTEEERKLIRVPYGWSSSGNFSKTTASSSSDLNWGFVRQLSAQQNAGVPTWGTGSTTLNKTLSSDLSGKNVDVVIMDDGTPYPSTLEFQQNADGTGYSRLIQYNWFQHSSVASGGVVANGTYDYSPLATTNSARLQEHGAHTMGTTAGNTHGWARDANIYFISFYDNYAQDYVLQFHLNKPINPETGVRNPTVMNNSWGYGTTTPNWVNISSVTHRGTTYTPTSGSAGSYVWDTTLRDSFWFRKSLSRVAEVDQDFIDLINAGVIVIASAGNDNSYADVPTGIDYNNSFTMSGTTYYPHRGSTPGAAPGVICVGAAGSHNEANGSSIYTGTAVEPGDYKAEFSNFGPRIDVWGAGSAIQSIWTAGQQLYDNIDAVDPRVAALGLTDTANNNFKKCPGTSMSGPNVCGVFACLAEAYPRMTQTDAQNYIRSQCNGATMQWTTGGINDDKDLGYSKNTTSGTRYMFLKGNRITDAETGTYSKVSYPNSFTVARPSSGLSYPRAPKFYSATKKATYSLTVNNGLIASNGTNSATVTLTTTGIANGTKIPYIITSKYKGAGTTSTSVTTNNGLYIASNSANTYSVSKTGSQFGGGGYQSPLNKRHKINMSVSNTNPTWIDDPNGFSMYDYNAPLMTWTATTHTINVTASGSSAYTMSGSDRIGTVNGSNAVITVNFGDTINFAVNATNHPFYIKYTTVNGGSSNQITGSSGVITNQGTQSGTVSLNTSLLNDASGALISGKQYDWQKEIIIYYQCGNHSSMKGAIIVRSGYPTAYDTNVECDLVTTVVGSTNKGDDCYWKVNVPWNVPIFGTNTNLIGVSANSYLTFGSGSHSYNNLTTLALNKLLLAAGDGSCQSLYYLVYGTAPNRTLLIEFYGSTSIQSGGPAIFWQAYLNENDTSNIYVSVIDNQRYVETTVTDRYPWYQDKILGGQNTTGVFTINNNTASLTITPDVTFTPPSDVSSTGMNVNVRLGFYGSPSVDFNVT